MAGLDEDNPIHLDLVETRHRLWANTFSDAYSVLGDVDSAADEADRVVDRFTNKFQRELEEYYGQEN